MGLEKEKADSLFEEFLQKENVEDAHQNGFVLGKEQGSPKLSVNRKKVAKIKRLFNDMLWD